MRRIFLYFAIITLITSCSEAKYLTDRANGYYVKSDYGTAIYTVIKALKYDVNNKKAQNVLISSYNALEMELDDQARSLKSSSTNFVDDNTVMKRYTVAHYYDSLIRIQKMIKVLPVAKRPIQIQMKDFSNSYDQAYEKFMEARKISAENHYQEGLRLSQIDGSEKAAVKEFETTLLMVPNYKDAESLKNSVLDKERRKNAESNYQEGLRLFKLGGIDNYKAAAKSFKQCMSYIANYKDASKRYDEAKNLATKRMLITSFKNGTSNAENNDICSSIGNSVFSKIGNREFLSISVRDEAFEEIMKEIKRANSGIMDENSQIAVGIKGVHEIITGELELADIKEYNEPIYVNNWIEQGNILVGYKEVQEKDFLTGELLYETKYDESTKSFYKVPKMKKEAVYQQGSVEITKYVIKAEALFSVTYQIVDAKTSSMKKRNTIRLPYKFEDYYCTVKGDAKIANEVMKNSTRELVNKGRPQAPSRLEIKDAFINFLSEKLSSEIIEYVD